MYCGLSIQQCLKRIGSLPDGWIHENLFVATELFPSSTGYAKGDGEERLFSSSHYRLPCGHIAVI